MNAGADPIAIQQIFARAIAIADPNQRRAYVVEQCAHDKELLVRVEELLAAYDEPKRYFDQSTAQLANAAAAAPLEPSESSQRPGSLIAGRYKLLEAIGEGGMGTVWVAEQSSPVRRKVALKLVKPGMDSRQVLARFDAERQALALMDHPNIAKVFDGGVTEQGRPFFAMEYVKGMPLTEYCDQVRLSVEERLKLFIPICQAVQHAHQKGIIHRDLKPSNVLICLYDGKPVPKVIDFGLAKAMYQPLTDHTLHTGHGLMLGTPLYMSPEQAEHNNLDVDTRTDIYSLGVMLYELLTGTTPLERAQFKEAAFGEILRLIKEVEPPKPSTRVSTNAQRASIAAQRNLDPEQLGRCIRGDLDWIVMKALDKERDRRYETANGLARDLERFLNQEAVEACPPSTVYRLKKQFQKHRAAISTAAAFLLLVCAGAVISTWQAYRATKAERIAVLAEAIARQERDKAIENERQAISAKTAESDARTSEEQARLAESQQRAEAESQRVEAEKQRDEAQRLQQEAVARSKQLQQLTEEQRRSLYASDMNLLRIEAQRGNLRRIREILMEQLPIHGEEDLRGFEWNYWYRYLTQAQVLQKFENLQLGKSISLIVPGGELVALRQGETTEMREVVSGKIVGTLPVRLTSLVDRPRFSVTGRSVHGSRNSMLAYNQLSNPSDPGKGTECTVYEPTGEKYNFIYPTDSFSHVSFLNISHDGRFVVALGNDVSHQKGKPASRLFVWNVDSQKLVLNQLQPRELNRVEFSPDGSLLVAYLCHGSQRLSNEFRDVAVVVDAATGEERGIVQHNDDLDDVYWMPDQQRLLLSTLGWSGANRLELLSWTIGADQPQRLSQETMPNYIKGAVSPDGRWLAVTGHTVSNIRLIDTTRGHVVNTLHNEATTILSLTFSADSKNIIACSLTGEVLKWSLSPNVDLFALQAKPLSQLAARSFTREANGYALSTDHSLLAVAHADGSVVIRTKDGQETVLKPGIPNATSGVSRLHFSQDRHYLAHQSSIGPDGRSLKRTSNGRVVKNGYLLEVYDLRTRQRLWQVVHSTPPTDTNNYPMEFDPDQRHLVVMDGRSLRVMNCETGLSPQGLTPQDSFGPASFVGSRLVRVPTTGRVLVGGISRDTKRDGQNAPPDHFGAVLVDAFTNQTVHRFELPLRQAFRVIPSPDGIHACVLNQGSGVQDAIGRVEIWNVQDGRQILDAEGSAIEFSADGTLAAIITEDKLTDYGVVSTKTSSIREFTVWDILNRRKLCGISLSGNRADLIRFSPDGKRLLTLHGKQSSGDGGEVPQGRLWDVVSGREILAMPVADVNVYNWDLVFDATGNQFTSLLLGKTEGTGGGGRSVVYDGEPLSPENDAQIVARRLMDELTKETPLPSEMVAEINTRIGLKPLVRETALALAGRLSLDLDRVADACMEIVADRNNSDENYERALRWAKAIYAAEPDVIRSKALLGAAQFRCGLIQESLEMLGESSQAIPASQPEDAAFYEMLRRVIQLLALQQSGATERVQELFSQFRFRQSVTFAFIRTSDGSPSWKWLILLNNLRSELPKELFDINIDSSLNRQLSPTDERIAESYKRMDSDGDGRITEQEVTTTSGSNAWADYDYFDADHDKVLTRDEFRIAHKVILLLKMGQFVPSLARLPDQLLARVETRRVASLDEALRLAPDYPLSLNAKAWLLATSTSDQIRNGPQAVMLAQRACELTEMKTADYLETLAASHAEAKNFEEAIKWQQQSLTLQNTADYLKARSRLRLYGERQSLRDQATNRNTSTTPEGGLADESSAPLLAPDVVQKAPRLIGMHGFSWSPDSKRLVLARPIAGTQETELQIIDRASGAVTSVVRNAARPSWSPSPRGPIAFLRTIEGQPASVSNQEIWLVNSDGSNLRKLSQGGSPSWSSDGRLFFFTFTSNHRLELRSVMPDDPEKSLKMYYQIEGYPTVSPDGTMMAYSMLGQLMVRRLADNTETLSIPLAPDDFAFAEWSPDGRFIVATSGTGTQPGVWLIEVGSGQRRLLAKLSGKRSAWSPDGRSIAVEDSSEKKILRLDVSSLSSLWKETPATRPNQP